MTNLKFLLSGIVIVSLFLGISFTSSYAQTAPDPISDLIAVPGNEKIQLIWTSPPNNGSPITSYKIITWETGSNIFTTFPNLSTVTTSALTGLKNGVSYSFKVIAINAKGESSDSNIVSATPTGVSSPSPPDSIQTLQAVREDGKVKLTWIAPNDNGNKITAYEIKYWEVGSSIVKSKTVTSTNAQITGLTNEVPYAFRVIAINSIGHGPDSNLVSATPSISVSASSPNQVRGLNVIPSNGQIFLSWVQPSANGAPITNYRVIVSEQNSDKFTTYPFLGPVTQSTITGLKNGVTYTFKVAAINAVGVGKDSPSVSATPTNRVPIEIINLRATPGDGQVTLNWSIPSGATDTISSYRIREYALGSSSFNTHTFLGKATKATITSLTNGVPYGFSVVAVSLEGLGPDSNIVYASPKQPPTSKGIPSAITDLVATTRDGKVTLSWTPPNDNGSPIIRYNVIQKRSDYSTFVTYPLSGDATSTELTGLINDITYSFKVIAVNSVGGSPDSNTVVVTPKGVQSLKLPSWIKNNAKWWAEGKISDMEYVQGIEYLLNQGIIKIK